MDIYNSTSATLIINNLVVASDGHLSVPIDAPILIDDGVNTYSLNNTLLSTWNTGSSFPASLSIVDSIDGTTAYLSTTHGEIHYVVASPYVQIDTAITLSFVSQIILLQQVNTETVVNIPYAQLVTVIPDVPPVNTNPPAGSGDDDPSVGGSGTGSGSGGDSPPAKKHYFLYFLVILVVVIMVIVTIVTAKVILK